MNLQDTAARAMWVAHPNREVMMICFLGSVRGSGLLLGQGGSCESEAAQWWSGALN